MPSPASTSRSSPTAGPPWRSGHGRGSVATLNRQACGWVVLDPRAGFGVVDCQDVSVPVILDNSRTTTRLRFHLPGDDVVLGPGESRSLRLHLPIRELLAVTVDGVLPRGRSAVRAVTSTAHCAAAAVDSGVDAARARARRSPEPAPPQHVAARRPPRSPGGSPRAGVRSPPAGVSSTRPTRPRHPPPPWVFGCWSCSSRWPCWSSSGGGGARHLLEQSLRHTTVRAEAARRECGDTGAITHPSLR